MPLIRNIAFQDGSLVFNLKIKSLSTYPALGHQKTENII